MKIISTLQSGRAGPIVYVNGRYGKFARRYVQPHNPRTPDRQRQRGTFSAISSHWRGLSAEQRAAWYLAAAADSGRKVPLNGFNYFVSIGTKRANLGLPRADFPPATPAFNPNPVAELAVANTAGNITLKLRVPAPAAEKTLVHAAAPVSAGVRCVQHYSPLGLLPAPVNGWSDITNLYVARYGVPPVGTVVFVRTCQYIEGWSDLPRVTSALVPAKAGADPSTAVQ